VQLFPGAWKRYRLLRPLKRATDNRAIADLSAFSEVSEFVIHERFSNNFKSKLNFSRHGVTKPKPTSMDLVTFIDIITPIASSRRQFDSICFDLSFAILALNELCTYGVLLS
jgi:hypothetical protein